MAEAVRFHQFAPPPAAFVQRQPPQRAHEGGRLVAFHRRIQAALLGQVADQARDIVRAVMAEDAANTLVRVDNAQQHSQGRRLARAVGAENTVDRAFGHREVHAVHCQRIVEALDEAFCFDRQSLD